MCYGAMAVTWLLKISKFIGVPDAVYTLNSRCAVYKWMHAEVADSGTRQNAERGGSGRRIAISDVNKANSLTLQRIKSRS